MLGAFDAQNQVMDAQVITVTAVSENSYKKGAAAIDLNPGRKMAIVFIPSANAGGDVVATSYEFQAVQADVTALTTNLEVLGSVTVAGSEVLDGKPIVVPFSKATDRLHLGGKVLVTGGTNPTVTLDAYLVPEDEVPANPYFAKAVDVEV